MGRWALILIIALGFQVQAAKHVLYPEATFTYPGSCYPVNCWRHYVGLYAELLPDGQTECTDTIDINDVKIEGYEHDWKNVCQAKTVRYNFSKRIAYFRACITFPEENVLLALLGFKSPKSLDSLQPTRSRWRRYFRQLGQPNQKGNLPLHSTG